MKPTIKIIVADDHPLLRQSLKMWINKQPDLEVIAEASDGDEAVKLVKELSPHIVVMDISMPKLNGIEATRQITEECPTTDVLALTVHNDNDTILSIIQAGAKGYLLKTATGRQVIQAIRSIIGGEIVWSFQTQDVVQSSSHIKNSNLSNPGRRLSPRELDILKLVARGKINKEIGLILGLKEASIKSHLTNLFLKLDVGTRTGAVAVGLKVGILTANDFKNNV